MLPGIGPGDLVEEGLGGLSLAAPPLGEGVRLDSLFVDPMTGAVSDQGLYLVTSDDGLVTAYNFGIEPPLVEDPLAPSSCQDRGYRLVGSPPAKWEQRFDWYFNSSGVPSEVDPGNAEEAFRDSVRTITGAGNDCNPPLPDNVSATANYLGSTSRDAVPNFSCPWDNFNVIRFGAGSGFGLAATCTRIVDSVILESDTRLYTTEYEWYVVPGPNCDPVNNPKWHVTGVTTHERGHTFGLAHTNNPQSPGHPYHVLGDTHPFLTMGGGPTALCDERQASLGLGDILGLEQLY
ncbi:hypothetical protein BH20ACT24_BH20ACT24_02480 [soil metagenome]